MTVGATGALDAFDGTGETQPRARELRRRCGGAAGYPQRRLCQVAPASGSNCGDTLTIVAPGEDLVVSSVVRTSRAASILPYRTSAARRSRRRSSPASRRCPGARRSRQRPPALRARSVARAAAAQRRRRHDRRGSPDPPPPLADPPRERARRGARSARSVRRDADPRRRPGTARSANATTGAVIAIPPIPSPACVAARRIG